MPRAVPAADLALLERGVIAPVALRDVLEAPASVIVTFVVPQAVPVVLHPVGVAMVATIVPEVLEAPAVQVVRAARAAP